MSLGQLCIQFHPIAFPEFPFHMQTIFFVRLIYSSKFYNIPLRKCAVCDIKEQKPPIEDTQTHSNQTTKTQPSFVEAFTTERSESDTQTKAVRHYTQDQQPPAPENL